MSEHIISAHHFEMGAPLREKLRNVHGMGTKELNHVQGALSGSLEHLKESDLHAKNFDKVFKHIVEKSADWKHLPPGQQATVETVMKEHLGIKEEEPA